ncbi:MAG: YgiQ family radical SAM protein, partial [Bacteroidales bacterium]|nr:YgiQ family radical SAM protein [Candidatus Colimorpha onthohippi]
MPFLPITLDEAHKQGWEPRQDGTLVDIIIVSGDAYIDHPSFGTAVIGRTLEAAGYRVAIIPQPNWRDDLRDFRKFGQPRLFFGVTSGVMDSMVNHYTAAKRLRHDDAYTPGGEAGFRPDRATYLYTQILKQIYPDTVVVIGGVEASMRRLAHYDYWDDQLRPSILIDCPADVLIYGMGEKSILKIAAITNETGGTLPLNQLCQLPQIAYKTNTPPPHGITLHSYEACTQSKRLHAENFHLIERESNKIIAQTLTQQYGNQYVVVNPPEPPMTTDEIDASFDLPYMRAPHPKYRKRGDIPAFEMIKNSVCIHRGCFGGCSFCTISAHQGKQIASRSEQSILNELKAITKMDYFHGVITDLGGPSANMYGMHGKDRSRCAKCARYSCIQPNHCDNLQSDHQHILNLYQRASAVPGIKHIYIGSGIRCDLFTEQNHGWDYFKHVVLHHVSGRLKVAPEHTAPHVLKLMRKPPFDLFLNTKKHFDGICQSAGLRY